ncbi:MAG: IS1595 family transposase [Methylovirgula sp.]
MLPSNVTHPIYTDPEKAREYLEAIRWPDGPICPHCGVVNQATRLQGQKHRAGLLQCQACEKQFSVTVGTLYERSHVPLNKWLLATHLLCSSKKGISAHQLYRDLGFGSYRTAWFMAHRIREGMRAGQLDPMGGEGKTVEVDETYFGDIPEAKRRQFKTSGRPFQKSPHGVGKKRAIVALVERGGAVRSFHAAMADGETVAKIVRDNIHRETRLHTDESKLYKKIGAEFKAHETVKHADDEYVRGDVTTNTVEGYFSIFKRGMTGVYQHCAEKHLHRYLAEFDFRYSNRSALGIEDAERAVKALEGIAGKRLTYRRIDEAGL